jgi:hypothetical protein
LNLPVAVRWLLVPLVSIAGCSAAGIASELAGHGLVLAIGPRALEAALSTDVRYGLVNAGAAIAFVVVGAMMAPRYRMIVALALYGAGAYVAWVILDTWFFPESHPRAYQISHVPLLLTLLGGLIGVFIAFFLARGWPAAIRARWYTPSASRHAQADEIEAEADRKSLRR